MGCKESVSKMTHCPFGRKLDRLWGPAVLWQLDKEEDLRTRDADDKGLRDSQKEQRGGTGITCFDMGRQGSSI